MSSQRPSTSKPRGICKYYLTPRGCFAGSSCKFLHGEGEKLTPYDKSKTCRFYAAGFCKRGSDCWFVHARPEASTSAPAVPVDAEVQDEADDLCCICYEKPVTYGLLGQWSFVLIHVCLSEWVAIAVGCSHIFCLDVRPVLQGLALSVLTSASCSASKGGGHARARQKRSSHQG